METIQVFVQVEGDLRQEVVTVPATATVGDIIRAAAQKPLPVPAEGGLLFVGEDDDPVDAALSLKDAKIKKHSKVHISRCRKIAVKVHFKDKTKDRIFSPATTVKTVRDWALHEFIQHSTDQVDHQLQLCESTVRPELTTQLGSLAKRDCSVCFDLVPVQRVEG